MHRKYCNSCFYPDNKPDTYFKDGKCSACLAFEKRKEIDWDERERQFSNLAHSLRNSSSTGYHCIVPVSGGKDSHYQVIKCLDYGLRPLAVNARTDDLTPIGRKNLDNIATLCDLVEVATNAATRRRVNRYTLQTIGDISWAEHITIFTIPFREAVQRKIPAIIYGENSQNEYGGPEESQTAEQLTTRWLSEFGGLNGLRVRDLIEKGILSEYDRQYIHEHDYTNIQSIFLGHYFDWDGYANAVEAREHGFEWSDSPIEGTGFEYENLDNYQTGIHDLFKYAKFGFGRATDIVNSHIRRGRLSRDEGRDIILQYDGVYGDDFSYLGSPASEILKLIDMTGKEFIECLHKFTNRDLFDVDYDGVLIPKFIKDLERA